MPITRAYGQASQLGNTPAASNPVINGAFDIWQRGTSFSLSASSGVNYIADRWSTATNASQACTISRQTTSDTTNLPNIQYCLRYQRNSGQTGTGGLEILNNFETVNSIPFAGKTVTLSFYARKGADYSPTSSLLAVYLVTGTGTDQSAWGAGLTGQATPINSTVTLTTTWQRFTLTATLNTNITQLFVDFRMNPTGTAGTNDYYEVTGVQIDLGSVALPFRRTGGTLAGELAACQRYFQQVITGGKFVGIGGYYSASYLFVGVHLPVEMRTSPTATVATGTNYYKCNSAAGGDFVNSLTIENASPRQVQFYNNTEASGTGGQALYFFGDSASASIGLSAEL